MLKPLLVDQAFLGRDGQHLRGQALWRARLHPLRAATPSPRPRSDGSTRVVDALRQGIANRGTTLAAIATWRGRWGRIRSSSSSSGARGNPAPAAGRRSRRSGWGGGRRTSAPAARGFQRSRPLRTEPSSTRARSYQFVPTFISTLIGTISPGPLHRLPHQPGQPGHLVPRRLEDQLVVHLQEHPRLQPRPLAGPARCGSWPA